MPSISESRAAGQEKLNSGQWKYVETPQAPPAIPAPSTAYPAAPNQYLRAPLPADMWQDPDSQRQFHAAAIPQTRISPLPDNTNPISGAQAASQAIAQIAATPATTGSSATDTDIIASINRQLFGGLDSFSQNSASSATNSINSISTTSFAVGANELAIVGAVGSGNSGIIVGQSPGAGWTTLPSQLAFFTKIISSAGSFSVSQTFASSSYEAVQTLLFLKTNGSTPVFTLRASQSGGTNLTSGPFTPSAGNTLLWTVTGADMLTKPVPVITDSAGLVWQLLANLFVVGGAGAHNAGIVQYMAQNVPSVSMTASLDLGSAIGATGGTWTLHEISNVNIGSGAYTFQSSDNLKLVDFGGGANVTATLPSSGFSTGWQCLVANNSVGNVTLTSTAYINQSSTPVVIGPGGFTWVFWDGTNYWVTATSSASYAPKIAHQWLDSYNPLTGSFGQSQPAVGDLSTAKTGSGSIVLATSPTITTPTFLGCTLANVINVNNVFAKYNNIATVSNGVPSEYATVDLTGQAAAIGATTLYTPAATGMFRISAYLKITTAGTSPVLGPVTITFTDGTDSVAQSVVMAMQTQTGANATTNSGNTTTSVLSGSLIIYALTGVAIQYAIGFSGTIGTAVYEAHLKCEQL